ncbi:glycoside hydrolase family 9 protein [Hahella sp. NBU794]|uniref:glycoside hydrolase family 9 protein n=1 Tax=Hahella sp. NBU794 TaxID=3422590 RepID=UPI003D6ECF1F
MHTPMFLLSSISLALAAAMTPIQAYSADGNPRVNQRGYLPEAPKVAVYATANDTAQTWELWRNGALVASGMTTPKGADAASGERLHQIDFSNVDIEGEGYELKVGGDRSYPFAIDEQVFSGPLYDAIRYYYHNRSGIEIEPQFTGGGRSSYAPDAKLARPAGHIGVAPNLGDYNVPCWPGTCNYSLDVSKGWYDAGDHGKYVVNGGISVWKLLNAYERNQYFGKHKEAFADGTLNIPESGNGVPDLLDEARWQMEFLLAMQVPEGEALAGMVHHKMHDENWTGLPLAPHEDPRQRYLVPPSTAATLNLAATAAQSARIWKDIDPDFAARCLTAAQRAWQAARQHPDVIYKDDFNNGGGGYGDQDVSDEFVWAAAELFVTTGDASYKNDIQWDEDLAPDWAWPQTRIPALMSLAMVPGDHSATLRERARGTLVSLADKLVAVIDSQGYLLPLGNEEYYWGSNNVLANKLAITALAYDFTGEDKYAQATLKSVDYLFGRNALSLSYVTGHGAHAVKQPHHRFWAGVLNSSYPWAPPGALAGGPNPGLEDDVAKAALSGCESKPQTCFIDDIGSWSTNEITINWNGALVWTLAFVNDLAEGGDNPDPDPNHDPVAAFSINASGLTLNLDASASSDPDGDTLTYQWDFGDGAVGSGRTVSHDYAEPGVYNVTLKITDGRGGASSATQQATLTDAPSQGSCEYIVQNEWNSGFVALIRIHNQGSAPVEGWEVSWKYSDGTQINNQWNANFSGQNPYKASPLGWNKTIQPGAYVEFGMVGQKGSATAQTPTVTGDVCQ